MSDHELPGSAFPAAPAASPAALTSPLGASLRVPLPGLTPITDQAVATELQRIKAGYSSKVGVRASTADHGTIGVFGNLEHGRLSGTGYSTWKRDQGLAAGAEVTFDLRPK